ncbi:hypothetical protein TURU_103581 [Turdus rufiventris]|nr:hypothetical protein TURU_103581 [Turdus rufiventris]
MGCNNFISHTVGLNGPLAENDSLEEGQVVKSKRHRAERSEGCFGVSYSGRRVAEGTAGFGIYSKGKGPPNQPPGTFPNENTSLLQALVTCNLITKKIYVLHAEASHSIQLMSLIRVLTSNSSTLATACARGNPKFWKRLLELVPSPPAFQTEEQQRVYGVQGWFQAGGMWLTGRQKFDPSECQTFAEDSKFGNNTCSKNMIIICVLIPSRSAEVSLSMFDT